MATTKDNVQSRLEFSARLNEALDAIGFPQKGKGRQLALGKAMKISQKGARKWLEGEALPTEANRGKLIELCKVNYEWLFAGRGPQTGDSAHVGWEEDLPQHHQFGIPVSLHNSQEDQAVPAFLSKEAYRPEKRPLPVIARVIAGNFRDAIPASTPDGEPWMESPRFSNPGPLAVWLIVDGNSMDDGTARGVREGDLILVDPDAPWDSGDYVIVANGSEEWTFKRLRKDGPTWYMEAANPDYRPRVREIPEGWRVVARVLEVKSGRKL